MPLLTSDCDGARPLDLTPQSRGRYRLSHGDYTIGASILAHKYIHTYTRPHSPLQVFEVMFERVNGVFGCRTRSVFDNQIPRSHVRTSLQTLVCRTAFDKPFDRGTAVA
ncbi:hypothetical protein SK128_012303 [Halocaridina rubra]|uniref:Uncharacterized protein n=1 Tax=Halocaridina rubra TaxID=373956 RepID=A0AAN9A7A4_HALRR